jgi:hypothetical protein
METMTVRQSGSDDRIDGLERKVDEGFRHVDRQFEQVDRQFEQMDKRFGRLEAGIDGLRDEMSAMQRSMVQFAVVFSTALAGLVVTQLGLILTQI